MAKAYINIGSNIGDRHALVGQAVAAIERALDCDAAVSDAYYSEPWGYDSPHPFLNVGMVVECGDMPVMELHRLLQRLQHDIDASPHRTDDGGYADRRIDIDLIAVDDVTVDTEELTLPHPRMHLRPFVLVPMMQLWGDWRHPATGQTPRQMLAVLSDQG